MKKVFVCHPFAGDPEGNVLKVRDICARIVFKDVLPLTPQLYLPHFIDEETQRDLALRLCLELVELCDEVRVYGEPTKGMRLEIAEGKRLGIPIIEGKIE